MKKILTLGLSLAMIASLGVTNVFAADNSTDDHVTNITYEVGETYKWTAPADITFTMNSNNLDVKTGTLSVEENVIAGDKRLSISVNDQDFKVVTPAGAERTYKIYKGSDNSGTEVLRNTEVLTVANGVNTGSQQLAFELQNVSVLQAGVYSGTVGFTASILAA